LGKRGGRKRLRGAANTSGLKSIETETLMNTCSAGNSGARLAGLIALVLSASLVAALTALLLATKYAEA
jgi:hypothetical protein